MEPVNVEWHQHAMEHQTLARRGLVHAEEKKHVREKLLTLVMVEPASVERLRHAQKQPTHAQKKQLAHVDQQPQHARNHLTSAQMVRVNVERLRHVLEPPTPVTRGLVNVEKQQ